MILKSEKSLIFCCSCRLGGCLAIALPPPPPAPLSGKRAAAGARRWFPSFAVQLGPASTTSFTPIRGKAFPFFPRVRSGALSACSTHSLAVSRDYYSLSALFGYPSWILRFRSVCTWRMQTVGSFLVILDTLLSPQWNDKVIWTQRLTCVRPAAA